MHELRLAVGEVGDPLVFMGWMNATPCPCTAATGNYSPDWHRDNPAAQDCGGRGIVAGSLLQIACHAIWQPAFLAGRTMQEFLDITQVGELKEMDAIVWATVLWNATSMPWSDFTCVEVTFFMKKYRLLHIIPVPWGEIAIFRQVT